MSMGTVLRIFLIVMGISIILRILVALAKRRMLEVYSVSWTMFAVGVMLIGIVIQPYQLERMISWPVLFIVLACASLVVVALFRITENTADMFRKISELAMQLSLVNADYKESRHRIDQLEATIKELKETRKE